MRTSPIAYQLYSAREEAQKDLLSVLKQLKSLGYDGVEFAGFYGLTTAQINQQLNETGLKAVSSHVPVKDIKADMFGTIAYHQAIGCPYIAIPYLEDEMRPGKSGFAEILQIIYRFGALCHQADIQLIYHNHDFEFIMISGMFGLDFIYSAVPESLLKTEIDVCWVKYAGIDPAEYLKKYKGRCPIVHLKDYVGTRSNTSPYALIGQAEKKTTENTSFEFRPFGYGCQNAVSVVEAGLDAGADWFIIEQDQSTGRTPIEAAKMSIDTLRRIGAKK